MACLIHLEDSDKLLPGTINPSYYSIKPFPESSLNIQNNQTSNVSQFIRLIILDCQRNTEF